MFSNPLVFLPIIIIAVAAVIAIAALQGPKAKRSKRPYTYKLQRSFLSPAEARFFSALTPAVPPGHLIFAQVRLADIFSAVAPERSDQTRGLNRITSKHVDFLICSDPQTPVLGIELDDRSHKRQSRSQRDEFINEVFEEAGLPLLRFTARQAYDSDQLRAAINQHIIPAQTAT